MASEDKERDTRIVLCPEDGSPEVLELKVFSSLCLVDRPEPECSRFEGRPLDCSKSCVTKGGEPQAER